MLRYPTKTAILFSILSATIVPFLVLCYAGLCAINIAGLLDIFDSTATVLDFVLMALMLSADWVLVYLLSKYLKSIPNHLSGKNALQNLWKILTVSTGGLSIASILFSMLPTNDVFHFLWAFFFTVEAIVGIIYGVWISCFAHNGRNHLILGLGVAIALNFAFDYNGCRMFEGLLTDSSNAEMSDESGEELGEETAENSSGFNLFALLGFSESDIDTLDDESLASLQEVSFSAIALIAALFAGLVVVHSVAAAFAFALFAIFFMKKNKFLKDRKKLNRSNEEIIVC